LLSKTNYCWFWISPPIYGIIDERLNSLIILKSPAVKCGKSNDFLHALLQVKIVLIGIYKLSINFYFIFTPFFIYYTNKNDIWNYSYIVLKLLIHFQLNIYNWWERSYPFNCCWNIIVFLSISYIIIMIITNIGV
jgi:hypothetical protein